MRKNITAAILAGLALIGANAQATVTGITAAGGTSGLLSFVNADSASVTLDIGEQLGAIAIGDSYDLTTDIISFISAAGGLSGVRVALIAGSAPNGTSAGTYLQSSANNAPTGPPLGGNLANAVRGTWFANLNTFVTRLNTSDPSATNVDFGPFSSGENGNYVSGSHEDWGQAGTCTGNVLGCNTAAGTADLFLYVLNFGTAATSFATQTKLGGGAKAVVDLAAAKLNIVATTVVPAPPALWLLATAVGAVAVRSRRKARAG